MEGRKAQLLPGDGVLIEFGSVVGAVQCAIGLQKLTTERNAGGPGDRRMEWRIGIHLGDAGRRRRGGRSRWQMPKIDVVRDILAGDRAVRDCGSAPEQGAGRVDRCREVDYKAREPSIERLT